MVRLLIDRLAVSQSYIDAIDHSMDIFSSLEPRKALLVTGMTDRARKECLEGVNGYFPAKINSSAILVSLIAQEPVNVRESAAYGQLKGHLETLVRETFNART